MICPVAIATSATTATTHSMAMLYGHARSSTRIPADSHSDEIPFDLQPMPQENTPAQQHGPILQTLDSSADLVIVRHRNGAIFLVPGAASDSPSALMRKEPSTTLCSSLDLGLGGHRPIASMLAEMTAALQGAGKSIPIFVTMILNEHMCIS